MHVTSFHGTPFLVLFHVPEPFHDDIDRFFCLLSHTEKPVFFYAFVRFYRDTINLMTLWLFRMSSNGVTKIASKKSDEKTGTEVPVVNYLFL